jgi:hypothetical protein
VPRYDVLDFVYRNSCRPETWLRYRRMYPYLLIDMRCEWAEVGARMPLLRLPALTQRANTSRPCRFCQYESRSRRRTLVSSVPPHTHLLN